MSITLSQWSKTAAENGSGVMSGVPDGLPENWTGSQINNAVREGYAVVRTWYDDPEWLEVTYALAARGVKSLTKISATQLDILLVDATAYFNVGRRVKIVGATTVEMIVTAAGLSGSDTRLTLASMAGLGTVVPTAPTAVYAYIGKTLRSGAFVAAGTDEAGLVLGRGLLHGRFEWVSTLSVKISRGYYQKLRAEVAGVLYDGAADLTLVAANIDIGGAFTASTWYHAYLFATAGVLTAELSATVPVMDPASGVVGYKTGDATKRFVGDFFVTAAGAILAFDRNADGWTQFRLQSSELQVTPGAAAVQATYALVDLTSGVRKTPASARAVRILSRITADDLEYFYGHESLSGLTVSTNKSPHSVNAGDNGGNEQIGIGKFDIPIDATPNLAWGAIDNGYTFNSGATHVVTVVGWRSDLGFLA